ncbi:alpha/beta-hydrolase [Roridomyces roridus]|uniref:Alpha/beta-hydrolase n=1 Tax=Roridomyces roridus TaxID=1738132 RepID=A0AAD7FRV3_9AGAR|nr:alpha/beta-hydrolase [Roridomyces roridus]
MTSPTVKVVQSTDGTTIFAEASGDPRNPHIVLLAGLGLSGCVFDDMCANPALLSSVYIVRYDVRGHGRSGKPTVAEAYESKLFADDFKTVMDAFNLHKPILAGWSMGSVVATDVSTHLPLGTLSGVVYLSGMPATGEVALSMVPSGLLSAIPGLLSKDDVVASEASVVEFTNRLFAHPEAVPYGIKCMYLGQRLHPEIANFSLSRTVDVEKLWAAGKDGLPLLIVQGTADAHRAGGPKGVEEVMKPHFKTYEAIWLEGRGHALHYESPEEIVDILVNFAKKVGGKDYRSV